MRRARIEHMSAGLPLITDIALRGWHGRKVPGTDIPRVSLRRGAKKTSHRYLVSHRLDAGKLNHSRPLLGLFGDKLVEVSWRA